MRRVEGGGGMEECRPYPNLIEEQTDKDQAPEFCDFS